MCLWRDLLFVVVFAVLVVVLLEHSWCRFKELSDLPSVVVVVETVVVSF